MGDVELPLSQSSDHEQVEEVLADDITLLNSEFPHCGPAWQQSGGEWCFISLSSRKDIIEDSEASLLTLPPFNGIDGSENERIIWLNKNGDNNGDLLMVNFDAYTLAKLEKRICCSSPDVIECSIYYYLFTRESRQKIILLCFGCYMDTAAMYLKYISNLSIIRIHNHARFHAHCLRCGYDCQNPAFVCGENYQRLQDGVALTK